MLRAKAYKFSQKDTKWRDRLITSTDPIFDTLSTPGISGLANAAAGSKALRSIGDKVGIHPKAPLPEFVSNPLSQRHPDEIGENLEVVASDRTTGKVAIYLTCYGDHNEPQVVVDLIAVLNHNGIPVRLLKDAKCCGMPKLELGDLEKVARLKDANLPTFLKAIDDGYDIIAPIPFLCADVQAGVAADVSG